MIPVSEALKELLYRQGMSAGSAGTEECARIDAGEPGKLDPAIGHRHGGETGPMGKEPVVKRPAKFPKLVWTNLRQAAANPTRLPSRAAASLKVVK